MTRMAIPVGRSAPGFSTVEFLLALTFTLVVVTALVAIVNPQTFVSMAQPEVVDVQQRLRAGAETLSRELQRAGAGLDSGPMTGALVRHIAPVLPRRIGAREAEEPDVARPDVISVIFVGETQAQATLSGPIVSSLAGIAPADGCPVGTPHCDLGTDDGLLVFDRRGRMGIYTVLSAEGPLLAVSHRGVGVGPAFEAGAFVARVETQTFYFDADRRQLRWYDGDQTDAPFLDNVSRFAIEYFGRPAPPVEPRPEAGEPNCLYDASGVYLSPVPLLPATDDGLSPLPLAMLADGPWCGEADTRFDVDLLRVRRLRITLGVSTPASVPASHAETMVFDVSPRNLGVSSE